MLSALVSMAALVLGAPESGSGWQQMVAPWPRSSASLLVMSSAVAEVQGEPGPADGDGVQQYDTRTAAASTICPPTKAMAAAARVQRVSSALAAICSLSSEADYPGHVYSGCGSDCPSTAAASATSPPQEAAAAAAARAQRGQSALTATSGAAKCGTPTEASLPPLAVW